MRNRKKDAEENTKKKIFRQTVASTHILLVSKLVKIALYDLLGSECYAAVLVIVIVVVALLNFR